MFPVGSRVADVWRVAKGSFVSNLPVSRENGKVIRVISCGDQPIDRPPLDLIRRPRSLISGITSRAGARAARGGDQPVLQAPPDLLVHRLQRRHTDAGIDTRFIVTSLEGGRTKPLYERLYCARSGGEPHQGVEEPSRR
jgi:hypothetical protein